MPAPYSILVVDDEPVNIDVLTGLLKKDYRLLVAKSGERALETARKGQPDLVLLDIMMPGMDGYEVCRRLKADAATRDIPVIFVTAMDQAGDEARGFEVGAADYLAKPVSAPVLRARVKTQLALVQGRRKLQAAYATIKAQNERMEAELNLGRDIQMSMMPQDFPDISRNERFSLYACLEAAHELGGDFYDFFYLGDDRLCFCVGDVSGKGVPAALFMAVSKTLVRSAARRSTSTAAVLDRVNVSLSADNDGCMFVTLFLAVCDLRSGVVTCTNAGHNPPFVIGLDGGIRRLDARHGPVAGALEGVAYREEQVRLEPGETLLLFTDGVTEAASEDGELFSGARLENHVQQVAQPDPEALVKSIVSAVHDFEGAAEQADDITVLAFRYQGGQGSGDAPVTERERWQGLRSSATVIAWFEAFADTHALDEAVRRRVKLVLDELLANALAYAWPGSPTGAVEVEMQLTRGELVITLADDGVPFNPLQAPRPDVRQPLAERRPGGLGIHLSRELMDGLSYQRSDGWNRVTLRIRLGGS
ncbi:MAG TPA: response regulator [Gammaproteobacteria bacterium]|nr:response regulator [Gammaproteobacteria bacterium]